MSKLTKSGLPRKSGSGRTKGAKSLCSVKMKDLIEKFSPDSMIVCGAIFIKKAGLSTDTPAVSAPVAPEVAARISIVTV